MEEIAPGTEYRHLQSQTTMEEMLRPECPQGTFCALPRQVAEHSLLP